MHQVQLCICKLRKRNTALFSRMNISSGFFSTKRESNPSQRSPSTTRPFLLSHEKNCSCCDVVVVVEKEGGERGSFPFLTSSSFSARVCLLFRSPPSSTFLAWFLLSPAPLLSALYYTIATSKTITSQGRNTSDYKQEEGEEEISQEMAEEVEEEEEEEMRGWRQQIRSRMGQQLYGEKADAFF